MQNNAVRSVDYTRQFGPYIIVGLVRRFGPWVRSSPEIIPYRSKLKPLKLIYLLVFDFFWFENNPLYGIPVTMELDTGAGVTIVSGIVGKSGHGHKPFYDTFLGFAEECDPGIV